MVSLHLTGSPNTNERCQRGPQQPAEAASHGILGTKLPFTHARQPQDNQKVPEGTEAAFKGCQPCVQGSYLPDMPAVLPFFCFWGGQRLQDAWGGARQMPHPQIISRARL